MGRCLAHPDHMLVNLEVFLTFQLTFSPLSCRFSRFFSLDFICIADKATNKNGMPRFTFDNVIRESLKIGNIWPITLLRGKMQKKHQSDIADQLIDVYRCLLDF